MYQQLVNPHDLRAHVAKLAGQIGERNIKNAKALSRAANYISDQWSNMGYEVCSQVYSAQGIKCRNLEITHQGTKHPDNIILIGAHYDTSNGCPDTNENGSGIAALLEVSRLIHRLETDYTVRFVAFTNQEPPFYGTEEMGSWVYAHHARQRGDNIRTAIILETLGFYTNAPASQMPLPFMGLFCPHKGNFLAMVSNLRSARVTRRFSKAFRANSKFPIQQLSAPQALPAIGKSDQCAFWLNGYKSFMVTDTAPYRYPFYHSEKDTPDRLDYAHLTEVTTGLAKVIQRCEKLC